MRARMSGGVLADVGTTIRTTFDGKDCPNAGPPAAMPRPIVAAPVRNDRLFMAFLLFARLTRRVARFSIIE
jgi:hypothetical protein